MVSGMAAEKGNVITARCQSKRVSWRACIGWVAVGLLLASAWVAPARSGGLCERPPTFDPDRLSGLLGEYELIGRAPGSAEAYLGRLRIDSGDQAYALRRTLDGERAEGSAWVEYCAADRYPVLMLSLDTPRGPLLGRCFFRTNGDNYYLLSCYTRYPDGGDAEGLEAMFQVSGKE
jgi:hypothetical protein